MKSHTLRDTQGSSFAQGATLSLLLMCLLCGCGPSLIRAVYTGNLEAIQKHIEQGTDPNQMTQSGQLPLLVALRDGNRDAARLLLHGGADPNLCDRSNDNAIALASEGGYADLVALCLEYGASTTEYCERGTPPLHAAAAAGNSGIVGTLLAHGADPNAVTGRNYSPLMAAAASGKLDTVRQLIDAGAQVNVGGWFHAYDISTWANGRLVSTEAAIETRNALSMAGDNIDIRTLLVSLGAREPLRIDLSPNSPFLSDNPRARTAIGLLLQTKDASVFEGGTGGPGGARSSRERLNNLTPREFANYDSHLVDAGFPLSFLRFFQSEGSDSSDSP
ncbi:MAG: ankyrin repeat domain-containing protein [Candidatus Eisenbacteria sp.]|nr:ankyrin repeat domain-containing protein [Candidatus Eisenbacteria bacterium]